jgi:hypothetical protein
MDGDNSTSGLIATLVCVCEGGEKRSYQSIKPVARLHGASLPVLKGVLYVESGERCREAFPLVSDVGLFIPPSCPLN